jgi:hypothetical protein
MNPARNGSIEADPVAAWAGARKICLALAKPPPTRRRRGRLSVLLTSRVIRSNDPHEKSDRRFLPSHRREKIHAAERLDRQRSDSASCALGTSSADAPRQIDTGAAPAQ